MLQPEHYAIPSMTSDGHLKDGSLDEARDEAHSLQSVIIRCIHGRARIIFPNGDTDEVNWDELKGFDLEWTLSLKERER